MVGADNLPAEGCASLLGALVKDPAIVDGALNVRYSVQYLGRSCHDDPCGTEHVVGTLLDA